MGVVRLPAEGPVHVSEDNGALVVTVPKTEAPGHTTELCDRVARMLFALPPIAPSLESVDGFTMQLAEPEFVADRILDHGDWKKLVIVHYVSDGLPHVWDIPGPFRFVTVHDDNTLTLHPVKVVA